jgi:hypothetical protein
MKPRIDLRSLVLGTILGAAIVFSVGAAVEAVRTGWEYKVVTGRLYQNELERAMNAAASDGWELVSASSSPEAYAFAVMKRMRR